MTERSGFICAGNWIVDLVHDITDWPEESHLVRIGAQTRSIGGGAANVISALSRLQTGLPLWPMGAVGDDEQGRFIADECRALGLPTENLTLKSGVPTAHTHVMSVAGRSRTFFYQGGANDALCATDFPAGTFAGTPARIFYLGYLTLLGELDRIETSGTTGAARVLERAKAAGLTTCIDLVSIQHPSYEEIVGCALPHIDYLILNEVEAAFSLGSQIDGTPEASELLDMASDLVARGVQKAVVVHSVQNVAWAGADGERLTVPVTPLAVDQIESNLGAGDAFCAGLLYGIHEGWAPATAIRLATECAKSSLRDLTATGAIPPLSDIDISERTDD